MSSGELINTDNEEEQFFNSDKVVSIVNLLTKFKIKLWEMEYFESTKDNHHIEDLIMKISDESGLIECEVKEVLVKLQKHSMEKLENNRRYRSEGIANFKLKIIGNYNNKSPKSFNHNIEIKINTTGAELKDYIIQTLELDCSTLKVICNGKVVREDMFLSSQTIKNHSTLLVMCIYDQKITNMAKDTADLKLINDIKDAVSLLNEEKLKLDETSSKAEFKVKNQNGISLDISKEDTNSLTIAMILHEKGKSAINSKDYLKALILLAEADSEFKNCKDTSLLDRVDNYALLNLDIVWCYLNLQNLHELKNAEERLENCEKCLIKCYGADLERLTKIKNDSASKHIPLFVRLNLFKGILSYHRGKKTESKYFLDIANEKMQKITIDEDKLLQIMSMGFNSTEARLALRASFNDVDSAVEQIFKKKQREKEANEIELINSLEKDFGKTLNQKPIDIKAFKDLIQLGFRKSQAAKALVKSDNNFELALGLLTSNPDFERENDLEKLVAMGFSQDLCTLCLRAFDNDLKSAIKFFNENKNDWKDLEILLLKHMEAQNDSELEEVSASTSWDNNAETAKKIFAGLTEEMTKDDEAYLDLNLEEDKFFINKYYSLLRA